MLAVVSWLFLAVLIGGICGSINLPCYYSLLNHGVATTGTIVELTPQQHQTAIAEYHVDGRRYTAQDQVTGPNPPLSELKVGDAIVVFYVPGQLAYYTFGDPRGRLPNELMSVIFAGLLMPTMIVGSFMLQRLAGGRKAPFLDP
jgi:hypothetical protein